MYPVRKTDGLINFRGFSIAAFLTASTRCLSSSPLRPCDIMQRPWQDVVVTNPTIWCFYQATVTIPTHPSLLPHSCTGHQWQGRSPASVPLPFPALGQSSPAGKAVSVWICSHRLEPICGVRCIFENLNVGLNLNTCFLQWTMDVLFNREVFNEEGKVEIVSPPPPGPHCIQQTEKAVANGAFPSLNETASLSLHLLWNFPLNQLS